MRNFTHKSSVQTNDNRCKLLERLKSIIVYEICRKWYNNDKLIIASLRRGSDSTTSQPQQRSTPPTFSFRDHCFLCAAEITAEFIAKQKQTHLLEHSIVEFLEHVNDLVAADAQYHNSWWKKYTKKYITTERRNWKRDSYANEIDTAIQYFYSYLNQHSEECQFSLDEDWRWLPPRHKKYGDDIISVTANKAPVICFRSTGFKLLTEAC